MIIMKKIFFTILMLFYILSVQATVIKTGISVESVPNMLFGTWRVSAKLEDTNSFKSFRPQSVDIWELSRVADTIKLNNPFSGANAEISVQTVEGNLIVFSKSLPYDGNKVLTDTVTLRLNKNQFSGINTLKLETFSLIDNHLLKTETASYRISGEKISGDNVIEN